MANKSRKSKNEAWNMKYTLRLSLCFGINKGLQCFRILYFSDCMERTSFRFGNGWIGHNDSCDTWSLGNGFQMNKTNASTSNHSYFDIFRILVLLNVHRKRRSSTIAGSVGDTKALHRHDRYREYRQRNNSIPLHCIFVFRFDTWVE